MSEKKKIVIDRSKWRTGDNESAVATGKGYTRLRNEQGFMCCLGFICKAAGINDDLLRTGEPMEIYDSNGLPLEPVVVPDITFVDGTESFYGQTLLADKAISINDSAETSLSEKEAALHKLFKESCYELEFVGEPTAFTDITPRNLDE